MKGYFLMLSCFVLGWVSGMKWAWKPLPESELHFQIRMPELRSAYSAQSAIERSM